MNLSHVWLKNNDQNDNKRTAPSKQWYEERKPIPFLTADRNMRDNAICSDESIFPLQCIERARDPRLERENVIRTRLYDHFMPVVRRAVLWHLVECSTKARLCVIVP